LREQAQLFEDVLVPKDNPEGEYQEHDDSLFHREAMLSLKRCTRRYLTGSSPPGWKG
jgi:hypothetical protein